MIQIRSYVWLVALLGILSVGCKNGDDDDSGGGDDDAVDDDTSNADPCDGVDNDGNGVVDDGYDCAAGSTTDCTEHGTCAGTATCGSDCTWGACDNAAWECTAPGTSESCEGSCNNQRECLDDCSFGACQPQCGKAEECCDSGCASLASDVDNCGACERACTEELWGDPPQCFGGGCCDVGCRNGSEICDDESFWVPDPYVPMFLVCHNDNGGVGYVATNTGPECDDGIPRCRGWEENGMNAWDHLQYVTQMDCTTAGQYVEVDLSAYAGQRLYVGVHDQPTGGGDMTEVCIAEGI